MIYETKCSFIKVDDNGNDKVVKERYIVEEAENFGDAEKQTYDFCDGETDLDVIDVKRSKLKEILNKRNSDDDAIWIAELQDVFTNDDGEEKYIVYKVAFFAKTFDSAMAYITEYMKQGYNLELVSIKKSKIADVIVV
jgi:hypothetical protein